MKCSNILAMLCVVCAVQPEPVYARCKTNVAYSNSSNTTAFGACGIHSKPSDSILPSKKVFKILRGVESNKNGWPWLVRLYHKRIGVCGGSLTRLADSLEESDIIVTAAHCTNRNMVIAGEYDTSKFDGTEQVSYRSKVKHFNESRRIHPYDLAVMKLKSPIKFKKGAWPICLPKVGQDPPVDTWCYTAGGGHYKNHTPASGLFNPPNGDHPNKTYEVAIQIIDPIKCVNNYKKHQNTTVVPDKEICAGRVPRKDACAGDSGGPLMCQINGQKEWVLSGLTSWGLNCATSVNIGGVYARVTYFLDFIYDAICEMSSFRSVINRCSKDN